MSDADIQFYTGISRDAFLSLVEMVSLMTTANSRIPLEDQLLLSLMRLRLGLLYGDLARRFSISVTRICAIFDKILGILKKIMTYIVVWLPRVRIQSTMPASFVENGYGRTTCIFDCAELTLQRPRKLMARAQTYSAYKAANTLKFLTVIAPNGHLMYVSDVYGGRASDKHIVRTCGVEDFLQRGDEIMADRGFALEAHLEARGIKLNVPAFTRGKPQLSETEVTKTRRIASVRIHVERAINRIKTYRIFKSALPIASRKTINDMVFVCAGLCNLKAPLIAHQNDAV
ncbi:uncharacterized protein LOC115333047 [Ixodes scapularis]|nr:uncharacterized protein LOC115333047 [Ixodes scapularis]